MLEYSRSYRALYSLILRLSSGFKKIIKLLLYDLKQNKVLDDSAGMLYATIVSIIPFFIIIFPFLRALEVFENIFGAVTNFFTNLVGQERSEYIVNNIRVFILKGNSLGFYGFITYSFSAVLLVIKLRNLFDKVYRIKYVEDDKNIIFRFFRYLIYIVGFAVFLSFFSFLWTSLFSSSKASSHTGILASSFFRSLLFYTIIVTVVYFIFHNMPKVYVSFKAAILGSIFFCFELIVLNTVMSLIINIIIRSMSRVYGYAADILIGFMWLNFFWKIFIAAADLSYIVQYEPDINKNESLSVWQFLQNSVNIMYMIIYGFKHGKGGEYLSELSTQLGISSQQVIEICDKFVEARLIHSVGKLRRRIYSPALPSAEIKVFYVLKAVQGEILSDNIGEKVVNKLKINQMNDFLKLSIEDL